MDALAAGSETSETLVGVAFFSGDGAVGASGFDGWRAEGLFAGFALANVALEAVGFEDDPRSVWALEGRGLWAERGSAAFGEVGHAAPISGFGDDPFAGSAYKRDTHQAFAELAVVPLLLLFKCFIFAVTRGNRPFRALSGHASRALAKAAKVIVGLGLGGVAISASGDRIGRARQFGAGGGRAKTPTHAVGTGVGLCPGRARDRAGIGWAVSFGADLLLAKAA